MKRLFIILGLAAAIVNSVEARPTEQKKIEIQSVPELRFTEDSVFTDVVLEIPGVFGKKMSYHLTTFWLMSPQYNDQQFILELKLTSNRRGRYIECKRRKEGRKPTPVLWTATYKTKKNDIEVVPITISTPRLEWMNERTVLYIQQFHSDRAKEEPVNVSGEPFRTKTVELK